MRGAPSGCLVGPFAALTVALGWRVVRCVVCGGADCWGAAGGLCNSQRGEPGRLIIEPPATAEAQAEDARQLSLFRRAP